MRVERGSQQFEQLCGVGVHAPSVASFTARKYVLSNVEAGHQGEFLKDHRNAEPPRIGDRVDSDGTSIDQEVSLIGMMRARRAL